MLYTWWSLTQICNLQRLLSKSFLIEKKRLLAKVSNFPINWRNMLHIFEFISLVVIFSISCHLCVLFHNFFSKPCNDEKEDEATDDETSSQEPVLPSHRNYNQSCDLKLSWEICSAQPLVHVPVPEIGTSLSTGTWYQNQYFVFKNLRYMWEKLLS